MQSYVRNSPLDPSNILTSTNDFDNIKNPVTFVMASDGNEKKSLDILQDYAAGLLSPSKRLDDDEPADGNVIRIESPSNPKDATSEDTSFRNTTGTPRRPDRAFYTAPKSPRGHRIGTAAVADNNKDDESGSKSPLFRKSFTGVRPSSPAENPGVPSGMVIPHGFENPTLRRMKGPEGLGTKVAKETEEAKELSTRSSLKDSGGLDGESGNDSGAKTITSVILDSKTLSSPIVSLILNHHDITGHFDQATFYVHKDLLRSTSLEYHVTPLATEIILDPTLKPYAVSAVLQGLYTGNFTVHDKFGNAEDKESYFQKLTWIELACCHFWTFNVRKLTLQKIEEEYKNYEFEINIDGVVSRAFASDWLWGLDEGYFEIDDTNILKNMRQRAIGGWLRDVSLLHTDERGSRAFDNLMTFRPNFQYDFREFLERRLAEDPKLKRKMDAFEKHEQRAKHKWEHEHTMINLEIQRRFGLLPRLARPPIQISPTHGTSSSYGTHIPASNDPPVRKRATRVEDKLHGTGRY